MTANLRVKYHRTRSVVNPKPPLVYYIGKESERLLISREQSLENIQWKLTCKKLFGELLVCQY